MKKRVLGYFYNRAAAFLGKYKDVLTINFKNKKLKFSTKAKIAKKWFYPRYISGKRLHEPPIAQLISNHINPKDVFFDIGANLGFFSVLSSHFCGEDGEVHAFEMDPQLIPLIEQSVFLNEGVSNIFINSFACDSEIGKLRQFEALQTDNPSTNRLMKVKTFHGKCVTNVLSLTIDSYCRQTKKYPDFMKVDIEGAEVFAIPGMLETLDKSKPKILLELHPEAIAQYNSSIEKVLEPIFDLNYKAQIIRSYRNKVDNHHLKNKLEKFCMDKIEKNKPNVLFLTQ